LNNKNKKTKFSKKKRSRKRKKKKQRGAVAEAALQPYLMKLKPKYTNKSRTVIV